MRKKYAKFEGSLKGIDSRILVAQVPGGMLTNMESQLKAQGAQPLGSTPQEYGDYIKSEIKRWGEVVKAANVQLN